jgi:16S rRNA (guanine1207-N2)-methyltransferase
MGEDHYFSAEPSSSVREREIAFMIAGRVYRLTTAGGVFSGDRLDPGTAILLRKAPLPGARGGVFLDLGCGYGPIACALADTSPDARVYAVDVNNRALDLTRRNAEAAGLGERVRASRPEDVPADVTFDEIWSNPPIRVGKAELHALLLTWLPRLVPDGVAWLVVAKHLGADSLQAWLTAEGYPTSRHASQAAFRILRVQRESRPG